MAARATSRFPCPMHASWRRPKRLTMGFHEVFGALYDRLGFQKVFGARKKMAARLFRQAVLMPTGRAGLQQARVLRQAFQAPWRGSEPGQVLPHDGRGQ